MVNREDLEQFARHVVSEAAVPGVEMSSNVRVAIEALAAVLRGDPNPWHPASTEYARIILEGDLDWRVGVDADGGFRMIGPSRETAEDAARDVMAALSPSEVK
jgi:hypothetical protein